jgi:UDP-N-acetylmuramyl pentapeptide phosphotransferase/UDP-N-acetylglucosamine-1-phosphate transferase
VLIKLVSQWRLFDSPGSHKIHSDYKPSIGGIAVLVSALFTLVLGLPLSEWISNKYIFTSIILMALIGLRDDALALTPIQKLLSQFLPVVLLVFFNKTTLNSSYGLFQFPEMPMIVIWLLSLFTLLILTNAFNLIDGIDGLAGTIGAIGLATFGIWFHLAGNTSMGLIAMAFAGALLGFLIFNWEPSKIFMGDTGALMIGMMLSFLALLFINTNYNLPDTHPFKMQASIATAVCVVIIPIFDTLRVIILRLRQGLSPFHADRNHLHHQFIKLGFSHSKSVIFIAGINGAMIILAWFLRKQNDLLILGIVIALCLVVNFALKWAQSKSNSDGTENKIN